MANFLNIDGSANVDGVMPIGSTANGFATWATITPGTGIGIANGSSSITISASGSTPLSFPTDAGTATPAANALTVAGGELINTAGSGATLTVNLDRGTDGQIPIAATGAATAYASLTSTGGTITFTPGANSLNLEAGGSVAIQVDTDSGSATPNAGVLDVVGAHGINTSGATNVVTVAINNAIALGDLSTIAPGSDALTVTSGNISLLGTGTTGANLNFPVTNTTGEEGVITFGGLRYIHQYNGAGVNANMFVGEGAGNFTSTGSRNSGFGTGTLAALTSGTLNTMCGDFAGNNLTTGALNTGCGFDAIGGVSGAGPTTGTRNSALGGQALGQLTNGTSNCAVGNRALYACTTGNRNIAIGGTDAATTGGALRQLVSGNSNICIGAVTSAGTNGAGYAYTGAESSNICLGGATVGTVGESNVMRLGTHGSSEGQVNRTYIAGEVTIPNQPAFEVYLASNATNVTGTGTSYLIGSTGGATWTENFDRGSDFDNSTSAQFTAPITGLYSFTFAVRMGGITAAMASMLVTLTMTGQNHVLGPINVGAVRNGSDTYGTTGSCLTNMVAGDTATLNVAIFSGAGDTADVLGGSSANTYFSGMLVA